MDFERLFAVADATQLSADDKAFVKTAVPKAMAAAKLPKKITHPAGFSVSGAPARTFTQ
ncbi:MAG: hypothetical protein JO348_07880, partial [Alphaproteobacteria bacterium]|nr:hypothetical protein [Alphaproteobacteria bacterium]